MWVMIVMFALGAIVKLCWLGSGNYPERKPFEAAADVVVNIAFLVWAILLLFKQ